MSLRLRSNGDQPVAAAISPRSNDDQTVALANAAAATAAVANTGGAARTIALQMLEERGRGAVLVGVARCEAALEEP
jgi:hypothetical protein